MCPTHLNRLAKLTIHKNADLTARENERRERFLNLTGEERLQEMFYLMELAILLGDGEPIKKPLGKGIILGR